jgi:gluconolactonase
MWRYIATIECSQLRQQSIGREAGGMNILADGLNFTEGPVALDDGSVLVAEIRSGTIARVASDGTVRRIATTGGGPNGEAVGPEGKLYVCNNGGFTWSVLENGLVVPGAALARGGNQPPDYRGGSIQIVDIETGSVHDLYTECAGHQLKGPNDIVFDTHAGFYFTDSGKRRDRDMDYGGLYYAKADGSEIREIAYPLLLANGVGMSPEGDRVYVAETVTARVWWWEVETPGHLALGTGPGVGGAQLLCTLNDYELIDSFAVEAEGNLCLATLNRGAITVVSPAGRVIDVVDVADDDPIVTNICFGGDDLRTAYITSAGRGRVYRADWPRPGLRLNYT